MLIERLEFIGFGNLTGQRIEFKPGKVNIVVQPNEYGKSTVFDAIWAVLYDYPEWATEKGEVKPNTARKPLSGAAYKACLDLQANGRSIRLIRGFADRSLKVLDLSKDPSKAESDITSEFANVGPEGVGPLLTGLDRRLFRATCCIEQRSLERSPFNEDRGISSLLLSIADTGAAATSNVFDAVAAIEDKLSAFSFEGKQFKIEDLLSALDERRQHLFVELKRLEDERHNCDRDVDKLADIEARLGERSRTLNADEYFQLCLEAADIDSRISRYQERFARVTQLEQQLRALEHWERFPVDKQKQIEEVWMRRQSRISDLNRLQTEVNSDRANAELKEFETRERFEGLSQFTIDDAQMLASLGHTLERVLSETEEARRKYNMEMARLTELGVNLESMMDTRNSLLLLEPRELDDLHALHAMSVGARERASECLLSAEKAQITALEIHQSRVALVGTLQRYFWPCLVMAAICLAPIIHFLLVQHRSLSDDIVAVTILVYLIFCGAAAASWMVARRIDRSYRVLEEEKARAEEHKYQGAATDLISKVNGYEGRIQLLARKAGLAEGAELVQHMQDYAVCAAQFKELDFVEHVLRNNLTHAEKVRQQIKPYFEQANRVCENVEPKDAARLADDINRYIDSHRITGQTNLLADHREPQMQFLQDELKDADAKLRDEFSRLNISGESMEECFGKFRQAMEQYERWHVLHSEFELLTEESTAEVFPSELPMVIERLEQKRSDIWARMQELIAANPEIAAAQAPLSMSENPGRSSLGKELADLRASVDELKRERGELIIQVRSAMKNYQDNYLKTVEAVEAVEMQLEKLRNTRTSLKLARDTLLRLADENHSAWATKLSEIAKDMLRNVASDFDGLEFDTDLSISVRKKGQRELLNEWQIGNQISSGTREQLHWLARMTVASYLSQKQPLPLIFDEPFSEMDDERFLRGMRFLITSVAPTHQVVIFSCHQQRHEWLMRQLNAVETEAIEFCQLSPLKSDAASFARR